MRFDGPGRRHVRIVGAWDRGVYIVYGTYTKTRYIVSRYLMGFFITRILCWFLRGFLRGCFASFHTLDRVLG